MPRFPDSFVALVRERADILEVVGRQIPLKRQGANWVGLCPFHSEKTPSFGIRPDKGFFKCFGCGASGDVIDFVMLSRGLEFADAVAELAGMAGLPLPRGEADHGEGDRHRALLELLTRAREWFRQRLHAPEGAKAQAYLQRRGFAPETVARFGLGYAPPGWSGLLDHFGGGEAAGRKLTEAGLAIPRENSGEGRPGWYDRFRDRLIFPIHDPRGHCLGFGGRVLDPEGKPKYINSPETPVYRKGEILYPLDQTQAAMRKEGLAVVVEGYLDALSLVAAGIEPVAATLGTALTERHLELLWRRAGRVVFCFDGDAAGHKAAARALDMILPGLGGERRAGFLFLPPGEDPDDFVRREGADAFRERLDRAVSPLDFLFDRLSEGVDATGPEGRAAIAHRARASLKSVGDPILRELYAEEMATRLGLSRPRLLDRGDDPAPAREQRAPTPPVEKPDNRGAFREKRELSPFHAATHGQVRSLVAHCLRHPGLAGEYEQDLARVQCEDPLLAGWLGAILTWGEEPDPAQVAHLTGEAAALLTAGLPLEEDEARREMTALFQLLEERENRRELAFKIGNAADGEENGLQKLYAIRQDQDRQRGHRMRQARGSMEKTFADKGDGRERP